ncbi:MAG: aldehyde dehydrogenase family protein [Planctomycetes bacterium]|nr:aldehyde dehydrogenase family protein [Planctomycetota bacterium]
MSTRSLSILESIDPATGATVGAVPIAARAEIEAAVRSARAAQPAWARRTLAERACALAPLAARLEERAEELASLITREMGKPRREALGEVRGCAATLAARLNEIAAALEPEVTEDANTRSVIYHDPFGVCAAIAPWNFPLSMPHSLVVPALMAGNAVVLKPSEETPLVAEEYAAMVRALLPAGVLAIVHGADEVGKALVEAEVDLIAFTGSRETGKKILAAAAQGLKRVILELGGKDPMIVLDDADLDKAAKFAVMNAFRNAGQVCVSTERIYVDEKIAADFEAKVAELTARLKVGAGTEEGVDVGPMVNGRQRDFVLEQVKKAVAQGARMVAGGGHKENFVMPTVLSGLTHDMDIMKKETFGPVACILRYRGEDEAVRLANDTPYGLGATVFGRDETRALAVARRLQAGMIGVNKSCGGASGAPWVGAKESGYGFHGSKDGHRQFAQTRVVSVPKG